MMGFLYDFEVGDYVYDMNLMAHFEKQGFTTRTNDLSSWETGWVPELIVEVKDEELVILLQCDSVGIMILKISRREPEVVHEDCEHCGSSNTVHNMTMTKELHQQLRVEVTKSFSCSDCGKVTEVRGDGY